MPKIRLKYDPWNVREVTEEKKDFFKSIGLLATAADVKASVGKATRATPPTADNDSAEHGDED